MSNISGFSDLKRRNNEKKEEGNEFYSGGNDSKGGGWSSSALSCFRLISLSFPYFRFVGSGLNVLDPIDRS